MTLLLLLWTVVLGLGLLAWQASPYTPNNLLIPFLKNTPLPKSTNSSLLKKLSQSRWLQPGWLIRQCTNQNKLQETINLCGKSLELKEIMVLKQSIFLGFTILFWLYIWFGDVSWKNTGWFVFLLSLSLCLPHLWLQIQKEKHLKALNEEVPYFIDLLSLTLQTGLNIEQALHHVVDNKSGLMATTIRNQLKDLELGQSLEQVLSNLKKVIPNPELQHFITHILRAKKLGVSLSNTLEIQSKLIRTKRRQRAEELSRTAGIKISIPLVLFIFPALLMIYIGPGLLNLMAQTG